MYINGAWVDVTGRIRAEPEQQVLMATNTLVSIGRNINVEHYNIDPSTADLENLGILPVSPCNSGTRTTVMEPLTNGKDTAASTVAGRPTNRDLSCSQAKYAAPSTSLSRTGQSFEVRKNHRILYRYQLRE